MNEVTSFALIEKKARLSFGTSRKIKVIKNKHNGKNETSWKIDYHIVNEATILALIEKKQWLFWNIKKIESIKI